MRIKNRKLICLILAFFVFVMCADNAKADVSLVRAPLKQANSYILSSDASFEKIQLCTTEMLGVHNDIGIRQTTGRFLSQRRDLMICLALILPELLSFNIRKYLTDGQVWQVPGAGLDKQITAYIHKSDGKKRI
ncbi:MAG: hypothetical protein IJ390_11695 [Lachnospiraceae bacterium]|nr:hypothetical protein [Lachnospiraceae bacterium]